MAFGRSNSLSINTGATNSLFSGQNNSSSQPPAAGGLFGGTAAGSSSQPQGSSLFGTANTNQAGAGLFGNSTSTSQPQQSSGGLFGGNAAATQPQQSGGLFGNNAAPAQPQQSGGLFGSSAATTQPQQSGGLFGNNTASSQPQQSGGLFGNTSAAPSTGATGLFGNLGQSAQPQQQAGANSLFGGNTNPSQQTGGSLFGSTANNQAQGTSLFGQLGSGNNASNTSAFGASANTATGSSLFPRPAANSQQTQPNTVFGLSASQPQSLLNASQYRSSQYTPFAGKLSMGQTNAAPATQGAVKINFDTMRPTTSFGECIEDVQKQLELIDNMVQAQEKFCREIEAFLPKHGQDVKSIGPDVETIKDKADAVESALTMDAEALQSQRRVLEHDVRDFQRCQRVVENQRMPQQFHMPSVGYGSSHQARQQQSLPAGDGENYDTDLIGKYFAPRATELQRTLGGYEANLAEIEAHLRVVESSAVAHAQQLAARRAGVSNGAGSQTSAEDNVRDLADTLRGVEGSILGAASLVGECREGVNELVLGRLGSGIATRSGDGVRRGW